MTTDTQTQETAAPAAETTALTATPAGTEQAAPAAGTTPAADSAAPSAPAAQASEESAGQKTDAKTEEGQPQGVPETYADFTVPEGVELNSEVVTDLKAFAKENNLTQEAAQKLVDLGIRNSQAISETITAGLAKAQAEWAEASRTDKEFGGDKLDENMALAKKTLTTFGTPELTEFLESSKLGDHPELVRWAVRVGKAISEDRLVPGGSAGPLSSQAFYAKSNMNP